MLKSIEETEFVIFDTETTGLAPESSDRIIEIAAIRFQGDRQLSSFQSLINPQREVSAAAFAVNRISADMLRGAPLAGEVIPKFLDFIGGCCLCSYNAGFDWEFLNSELKLIGQPVLEKIVVVDILKMARRLLPGLERYALWFVAERLGIKTSQQHRALADVELTLAVFQRLKSILAAKDILDFDNFLDLFSINPHLLEDFQAQKITQIQQAIDLQVKLKIRYLSASGAAVSEREVVPKQIKQENSRKYLVGFCHLRNQERTFRIDGILHLEIV